VTLELSQQWLMLCNTNKRGMREKRRKEKKTAKKTFTVIARAKISRQHVAVSFAMQEQGRGRKLVWSKKKKKCFQFFKKQNKLL
jgi:hypothetical protein